MATIAHTPTGADLATFELNVFLFLNHNVLRNIWKKIEYPALYFSDDLQTMLDTWMIVVKNEDYYLFSYVTSNTKIYNNVAVPVRNEE